VYARRVVSHGRRPQLLDGWFSSLQVAVFEICVLVSSVDSPLRCVDQCV
jgi:hypothetical protein